MLLKNGTYLSNGRYRIDGVLGQGGFGITYVAYQDALKRKVAIKEFFVSGYCDRYENTSSVISTKSKKELVEDLKKQFVKEARLIATLSDKHVVKIHDVFEENDTAYYVMEYHDGYNLQELVDKCGPLSCDDALRFILQVSKALARVHEDKILHLDIKPSNIMLNKYNEAVLIDFGVSKHYDKEGKQTSLSLLGVSEGYASGKMYVENAAMSFDPSLDVYSLAATLYFLITGVAPRHAEIVKVTGLSFPKNIPQRIADAINRAMLGDGKEVVATVDEFISLLPVNTIGEGGENNPVDKSIRRKIKYATYTSLFIIISLLSFVAYRYIQLRNVDQAYMVALQNLNSYDADEVRDGLQAMEKLANKNYPKAMYEVAFTFGWYDDSTSISRKNLLGIDYETTGNKKYLPKSQVHKFKVRELYERILSLDDEEELLEMKANAAYKLASFFLLLNDKGVVDYDMASTYLHKAKNYAEQIKDSRLIRKIDNGLRVVNNVKEQQMRNRKK